MRAQIPPPQRPPGRPNRYSFQFFVESIAINIKFPCKLTLSCNYSEGTLRGTKIVPLLNGIAAINQTISFTTSLKNQEEREPPQQSIASLEVSIITQSGTSLAGVITLNLQQIIDRNTREEYPIERCPDKQATAKVRVRFQFLGEKGVREQIGSPDRVMRGSSSQSEVTLHREKRGDSIRTSDLMKEEVSTWKHRVNECEGRYRSQKAENTKLNELLKGKEEIYLSLKTEIKRREIEVQTLLRTLQEYKGEYSRSRGEYQVMKKERDRYQTLSENIEKLGQERMAKLESESETHVKKIERLLRQNQRLRREKESAEMGSRTVVEISNDGVKEAMELRRENQEIQRQLRVQRETYQRQLKELRMNILEKEQNYTQLLAKHQTTSKKLQKLEQSRVQQLHKISQKMLEIQKSKESFNSELHVLKKQRSRKELGAQGHVKTIQRQLSQLSLNNMRLAQTVTELQGEKVKLQKESEYSRSQVKVVEEERNKCVKEVEHLKYQIENLNELILSKNNEIKQLGLVGKEQELGFKRRQEVLEEEYLQSKSALGVQLEEMRKNEESKYIALTQVLIKKEREFEGVSVKEQKLLLQIESLQQQLSHAEERCMEKVEGQRSQAERLREEGVTQEKKRAESQKHLREHIHHLQFQIQTLNESLMIAKESEFRLLEIEERNRLELEQLKGLYSSVNLHVLQLKEEIEEYTERIQRGEKNQSNINGEIAANQARFRKVEAENREKMLELEGERMKLVNLLKQKEKSHAQLCGVLREEIAELKREGERREGEWRKQYDEYREGLQRERGKVDELEMEIDRVSNELTRATSASERSRIFTDQLESDIRNYKETIKVLTISKEGLEQIGIENEEMKREVESSRSREMSLTHAKEREVRAWKGRVEELDSQLKELELGKSRVGIVMEEVHSIVSRIGGGVKLDGVGDQYERVMEVRKGLFYIESRIIKQSERISEMERVVEDRDVLKGSVERLEAEKIESKKREMEMKRTQESLRKQTTLLKKNNQQLLRQLSATTSPHPQQPHLDHSIILANQITHLKQIEKDSQLQLKAIIEKYEQIVYSTRVEGAEKLDRVKKELISTNRHLETKVEELQHRIFTLEIENQRVPELGKKDEEIKRLMGRVFELEREIVRLGQENFKEESKPVPAKVDDPFRTKLQKQLNSLTSQNQRLNSKCRDLNTHLKEKETQLQKLRLSLQSTKSQSTYQKSLFQHQKSTLKQTQQRQRTQIQKLKSQILMLKKLHQQSKTKLFHLQSSTVPTAQMKSKQQHYKELETANSQLNEEVFGCNQRIQQLEWEIKEIVVSKDNEIMSIQEELYSINSKENVGILKEVECLERLRAVEKEKMEVEYLLHQSQSEVQHLGQSIRQLEFIVADQQANINVAVENERKYQQVLKSLKVEPAFN